MTEYVSLKQHLNESELTQPVNEVLLLATIIATACLAHCITPALKSEPMVAIGSGIGNLFTGIGSLFGIPQAIANRKKDKKDKDGDDDKKFKKKKDKDEESSSDKSQDKIDVNDKSKGGFGSFFKNMLGLSALGGDKDKEATNDVAAVLLDENGEMKKLPLSDKDKEKLKEIQEKHKLDPDKMPVEELSQKVNKQAQKNPKLIEKAIKEGHKVACDKLKRDTETACAEIEREYHEKMEGASDEEKKNLKKEMKEKIDARKKLGKDKLKTQDAKLKEALVKAKNRDDEGSENKPEETPEDKPETKEIDGETFTKDKDGKWVNKDGETMEVTTVKDKEGKEVKAKVYTGPKGGRYYWPKGAPHTPEHKVYVQESLSERFKRML